jgi:hypothetical protein
MITYGMVALYQQKVNIWHMSHIEGKGKVIFMYVIEVYSEGGYGCSFGRW